jgi:hypothetical protein
MGKGSRQTPVGRGQMAENRKRTSVGGRRRGIVPAGLFIFLLLFRLCSAQNISFDASVDRTEVGVGEQITLTVSVSGDVKSIPEPDLPSLDEFSVYSAGRSQNFTYVNGRLSASVTFNYVLVPRKAGELTIGPASIKLDGKTYQTSPIQITVASQGEAPAAATPSGQDEKTVKQQLRGKDIFMETVVDKKKVYVNEQIVLTLRFYQSIRLFDNPEYTPPSLTGFWAEDLPPKRQYHKVINGTQYLVQEIKTALFPTSTGKLTVGPAELKCVVEDADRFSRDPFAMFDRDLFSLLRQGKPKILKSEPIQIEVLPTPEIDRPATFIGTVGDYSMKVGVDKSEVEVGQPVTLKAKISGSGNIKSVGKPVIAELPDFRTYSSGSSENVSKQNYQVQGTKTYEDVLIPKNAGKYTIPPVEFSFFNPNAKSYKTLKSEPILLTVLPPSQASPVEMAQLSRQEIGRAAKDIRYIKLSAGELKNGGGDLYRKPLFLLLQLIPLLAFAVSWRYQKEREKINSDIGYARQRRAHKLAQKRLKGASRLISEGSSEEFYCEVARASLQFIGDKLNLPGYGLTKDRIEDELARREVNKEKIDHLTKLLDSCDFGRFAPGSSTVEEMKGFLKQAEKVIADLED